MNEQAIEVISDEIAQEMYRMCVDIQQLRTMVLFDYDTPSVLERIKRRETRITTLRCTLYHIVGGSETAERARALDTAMRDIQMTLVIS